MTATIPRFMTTEEVADALRTPADTIRYWSHVGKGPRSQRVGRRRLYAESDVAAWLAEQREQDEIAARAER